MQKVIRVPFITVRKGLAFQCQESGEISENRPSVSRKGKKNHQLWFVRVVHLCSLFIVCIPSPSGINYFVLYLLYTASL